jgi:hypothetical protein
MARLMQTNDVPLLGIGFMGAIGWTKQALKGI